jgi:hypothetical protein
VPFRDTLVFAHHAKSLRLFLARLTGSTGVEDLSFRATAKGGCNESAPGPLLSGCLQISEIICKFFSSLFNAKRQWLRRHLFQRRSISLSPPARNWRYVCHVLVFAVRPMIPSSEATGVMSPKFASWTPHPTEGRYRTTGLVWRTIKKGWANCPPFLFFKVS